jgi:hypothetical protein
MLDKVVILSCRKQAYMIFTDRAPFGISSDVDVVPLLMWFLDFPNARLIIANDGETVLGIEVRRDCGDEVTLKIEIDVKVAA